MLDDGKHLYCLWVSRDPEEIRESVSDIPAPSISTSTSRSATNKTDKSQSGVSSIIYLSNLAIFNFAMIF